MVISDLNYLQAADLNIVGGSRRHSSFKIVAQVNYSDIDIKSKTVAKAYHGDATAYSYNDAYVSQSNSIG